MRALFTTCAALALLNFVPLAPAIAGDEAAPELRAPVERALGGIRPESIRADLQFLADDALEGRGTGTRGFDLAARYLRSQLAAIGAVGAAGDGFFQNVPLRRTVVDPRATTLEISGGGGPRALAYGDDFVLLDTHRDVEGQGSGRVVFVGYGVTAPELGYDDYAGLDVRDAVVVMFDFEAPSSFPSTVRAYYANHDVKRALAAEHGAAGMLYIRSPASEGRFPWPFMLRELEIGWNSKRWLDEDGRPGGLDDRLRFAGTLNRFGAEALFAGEAKGPDEIFAGAAAGRAAPFALTKRVEVAWRAGHERVDSPNIVARLEGSDPALRSEHVVLTAHADHLGIGPEIDGDAIYNGAMDNASGCAVLLAVARAFAALPQRPARSLLFVFVTGEEAGLLGSDYFARHPTVPAASIVADLNVDGGASLTDVDDVIAWGDAHSSLGPVARRVAAATGFSVAPDPFPEEGLFVRSDQFSFVAQGIPALFVEVGVHSTEPGVDGLALLQNWLVTAYHSPRDDASQPIRYDTMARFAGFAFALGHAIASAPERPQWNEGDFFGTRFGRR